MKGVERKKEVKKEKSDNAGSKVLTDYQKDKKSKSDKKMPMIPKT